MQRATCIAGHTINLCWLQQQRLSKILWLLMSGLHSMQLEQPDLSEFAGFRSSMIIDML